MRGFHRKYEETFGYLKAEELPPIDWTDKRHIEELFPEYRRNFLELERNRKKAQKIIEVESFDLKSPDNSEELFNDARLYMEPNKRCALFGINGSGKTTLFHAISSGKLREFPNYVHVHHMKELEHHPDSEKLSVIDTILTSHPYLRVLTCVETVLKEKIAEAEESNSEDLSKLKTNLEYIQRELTKLGAHTAEKRVKQMLRVLGFDEIGEQAPISSLSGGLRMRVALASAFFIDPDLLLLDEPTNHLDMPSVLWLENKLRGYKGSFLLVTHDRTLLENVVTSVMVIQDLKLEYYDCGFKEYEKRKEKDDQLREKKIDQFLAQNRNIDPTDPVYRVKMKYQDWQRKRIERQVLLAGKFTFKAPEPLPCEPNVQQEDISLINIENVRFSYDVEKGLPFIFDRPISYNVRVGTRVGVMGPNGAGKSTFLKLITGKLQPTEGSIRTNPDYTLAYFGQHSTKELKLDMTPTEFMISSFPDANPGELKSHLEKTSIPYGPANTPMRSLSFSQRSCVIFAKLTYVPPHLLIMDEPTNFLDLDSVDSLIMAVNKFKGGLIVVTHNRDFLKRCSKHFLSIIPGAFLEFKTMKEAERATYSFITAMEEGKAIDVKNAIVENRGGGAIHTEEYLEAQSKRLTQQQLLAKQKEEEKRAEEERLAKIAAEKEARRQAKLAAQKLDWVVDEVCWAPVNGKYVCGKVVRNVRGMGVTVELVTGKKVMVEPTKLRQEEPEGNSAPKKSAEKGTNQASRGRGGARGAARGGNTRGRGRGGAQNNGGRGRGRGGNNNQRR